MASDGHLPSKVRNTHTHARTRTHALFKKKVQHCSYGGEHHVVIHMIRMRTRKIPRGDASYPIWAGKKYKHLLYMKMKTKWSLYLRLAWDTHSDHGPGVFRAREASLRREELVRASVGPSRTRVTAVRRTALKPPQKMGKKTKKTKENDSHHDERVGNVRIHTSYTSTYGIGNEKAEQNLVAPNKPKWKTAVSGKNVAR